MPGETTLVTAVVMEDAIQFKHFPPFLHVLATGAAVQCRHGLKLAKNGISSNGNITHIISTVNVSKL